MAGMCGLYIQLITPPGFHKYEELKSEIENKFDKIIENLQVGYEVRYIYFVRLREKIKNN